MLTLSVREGGISNMALLHQDPDTYEIDPEIALGIKIHCIHPPPKEYKVDYQNTKGNMPKCTETKRQMHSN